jgi:hypothetical protein
MNDGAQTLIQIYLHSQGKKKRQHGTEAVKSHIVAAKTVANIVKTSLVWSGGSKKIGTASKKYYRVLAVWTRF